jgi:hypothetical protein
MSHAITEQCLLFPHKILTLRNGAVKLGSAPPYKALVTHLNLHSRVSNLHQISTHHLSTIHCDV